MTGLSSSYGVHKRMLADEKPVHECDVCSLKFSDPTFLLEHKTVHSNIYSHCEITMCDNKLTNLMKFENDVQFNSLHCVEEDVQPSYCNNTMMTKNQEMPYRCMDCDKSFSKLKDYNKHVATHTGRRPHKCLQCDETFHRFYSLQ